MTDLKRPLVRYHGGKWKLAPWIIGHFPSHRIYTEPFGGGGSVLLRKPRAYGEIYNDLDGEIVNLFRVARDRGEQLRQALILTPFARAEFALSYQPSDDPLEQARRTLVRSFMGFGSAAVCGEVSGFRANSNRSGTTPAQDWRGYPDCLSAIIERLRGVVIEQRHALEILAQHDGPETLHYCDPPYVHGTRMKEATRPGKCYRFEMSDEDHQQFSDHVKRLKGMVIVSGYDCELYRDLFSGWFHVGCKSHADGARARVEILWMNDAASSRQRQRLIA